MPQQRIDIDKDRLRELASDPLNDTEAISEGLGMSSVTLHTKLRNDDELKQVFTESRTAAKAARKSSRKSAKKSNRQSQNPLPPRKTGAKANHEELFKKLLHEFDHIDLYGATSEHFDELRGELSRQ